MAVPKRIGEAKGAWQGKSRLNLPWLPPEERITESASELRVETDRLGTFATLSYTWEYDGERHEGTMLVCKATKSNAVTIGWSDSWHQNSSVLHLVGAEDDSGTVKTQGVYSKELWEWTIGFELTGDELILSMDNISPEGQAEWAVRAVYRR